MTTSKLTRLATFMPKYWLPNPKLTNATTIKANPQAASTTSRRFSFWLIKKTKLINIRLVARLPQNTVAFLLFLLSEQGVAEFDENQRR